jgi:glycosyltransferase involved in cell wall biosynthesis
MRNPVDLPSFDRVKCSRNLANGVFTILFVGLLSPAKGFVDLLRAVPRVLKDVPQARFLFAGEWLENERNVLFGENGQRLDFDPRVVRDLWEKACARYGSQLKHLGIISGEEKTITFKSADVLVFPSYSEGLPLTVLEAMAASLPVVVTPVGALPEILQSEVNAKFVPCGDVDALARALVDLARDPIGCREMGIANRRLVEMQFTPEMISAQLADILREIVHLQ